MSTHTVHRPTRGLAATRLDVSRHWAWLAGGFALAFAVPFLFADVLELQRDLFYGLYALSVAACSRSGRARRSTASPTRSGGTGRGRSRSGSAQAPS